MPVNASERARNGRKATQRGIGLIEILVAVVLVSIGFLAAAKMQVEGMRFSQSAYFRSQAYFMATDIIDRMRANPQGVAALAYAGKSTAAGLPNPGCAAKACNESELAAQDLHDWSAQLHPADGTNPALPSGKDGSEVVTARGVITRDAATDSWTVTVFWAEVVNNDLTEQRLPLSFVSQQ